MNKTNVIKDSKKMEYLYIILCERWPGCHLSLSGFSPRFVSIASSLLLKRNDNMLLVIIVPSSRWCTYDNPIRVWNLSHSPESFLVTLQLPCQTPAPYLITKISVTPFQGIIKLLSAIKKHGWHTGFSWTYFFTLRTSHLGYILRSYLPWFAMVYS